MSEEKEVIEGLLRTVAKHFNEEDRATRERQIRYWRRLKLYWNNFSQVYWSESAHDYKIFGAEESTSSDDQSYYDKPVNVFKAFLETIIAALSIQIPSVSCVPDDAEKPLDVSTAKAGDKIAELIYKHNDVMFLWLHALYIYCTEGLIACYSYPKESLEFGSYTRPKYDEEEIEGYSCASCGTRIPDDVIERNQLDEYAPETGPICPECEAALDPEMQKHTLKITRLVGETTHPKARVCLEVYGGLYVKVANYAKKQEDTPYLIFSHETHYANVLEKYPSLRQKISQGGLANSGVNDPNEQFGRLNTQYRGEFPDENVTVKNCWLRPASFNILKEEDYKKLKKKFPNGVMVVLINDVVAEFKGEALDDCWTLTQNPMADFLNHDPLGDLLTNIQDIVNDLISLTMQTIEHGIAQTWADPAVVNFEAQKQIEAQPGTITPTKPVSGSKNLSESFFTTKTATLSAEVFSFYKIIQELGQFVSGALPSLFGGQQNSGSSRTASEYAMAKGMALQRLQTPWKMMTIWWKKVFGKAIPMYMKIMQEDERIVEKTGQGGYLNTFIKRADLDGRIGEIELEPDDKLPVTDEQQADMIMQLFQLNNEEITGALMDPDNIPYIKKIVKIPNFKLPGEADRQKQYEEIALLVVQQPVQLPPSPESMALAQQQGVPPEQIPPQEQSSIPVDPDIDNHAVEASICKSWLISDAGRIAKLENPEGYKNVLLHMKEHTQMIPPPIPNAEAPKVNYSVKGDLSDPDTRALFEKMYQLQPTPPPPPEKTESSGNSGEAKPADSERITGEENGQYPVS